MNVHARQLNDEIESGNRISLIDVRTPVEHEEMHIIGSRLMPLDQLDAKVINSTASGNDRIVLICRSGKRAEQAYEKFRHAGFENLSVLEGGISAWEAAGLPLERSKSKRLPLMRQVQLTIGVLAMAGSILALTIHKNFAMLPAFLGAGLIMAGSTGWCGLAIFLSKMPWNRVSHDGTAVKSCSI